MIKAQLSKLLLLTMMLTPLLSINTQAAFAAPVLKGIGMTCKPEIQKGRTDQIILSLYGDYTDGVDTDRQSLFGQVPLSSSESSVAEIDANSGFVTAYKIGTTVLSAVYGGHNIECQLDVTDFLISPESTTINVGETEAYTATYIDAAGNPQDVTSLATWGSSNPTVASSTTVFGEFKGDSVGAAVIQASYKFSNVRTNLGVYGTVPTIVSVEITPDNPLIKVGEQQVFTAIATYSDATKIDITTNAASNWMTGNPLLAQMQAKGTFISNLVGSAMIGVCYQGACDSTNLTVIPLVTPPREPEPTPEPTPTPEPIPVQTPEPTARPESIVYGSVDGVVVYESTGQPIKNVRVEIHSDPQTTITDEFGRYSFKNLPLGVHTVRLLSEELLEIGKISLVMGDFMENGKNLAELEITKEKPHGKIDFYLAALVKEVVVEPKLPIAKEELETQPETPVDKIVTNPIPIIERQENTVIQVPVPTKPTRKPEPTTIELPNLEPKIEEITVPTESIVNKDPEPMEDNDPLPEPELPQPDTSVEKPIIGYVPLAVNVIAVVAGILIIITFIRRKRITIVIKRDEKVLGSIKVPVRSDAIIKANISDIAKKVGWIEITISPEDTAKIVGKTLEVYQKRMQFDPIIEFKVTENDAKEGFTKKYRID